MAREISDRASERLFTAVNAMMAAANSGMVMSCGAATPKWLHGLSLTRNSVRSPMTTGTTIAVAASTAIRRIALTKLLRCPAEYCRNMARVRRASPRRFGGFPD